MGRALVHRQQRKLDIVRFDDGASGAVLIDILDLKILMKHPDFSTMAVLCNLSHHVSGFWQAFVRTLVTASQNTVNETPMHHNAYLA